MRHIWLIGLLIASVSAIALALLPSEAYKSPSIGLALLAALMLGMVVFAVGSLLRVRQHRLDVGTAMKRFATTEGGDYRKNFPTDRLPASISLFQVEEEQRCPYAIALKCAGRSCLLLRYERCIRRADQKGGIPGGVWWDYYVAYMPRALPGIADFRIQPDFIRGRLMIFIVPSVLVLVVAFLGFAFTRSAYTIATGLIWLGILILGTTAVLLTKWVSHQPVPPAPLEEQVFEFFSKRGLCAECVDGNLVVWTERNEYRMWRTGWQDSLRTVDESVAAQLRGLLEAARKVMGEMAR